MTSVNWSDLIKEAGETTTSFEPLPDGDYELKVIDAKATNTQTGKTMFKITTEVQGGPYAKRRIWDNLVVSPENGKALGMFFMKMTALGLGKTFFDQNPSNAQIEQALFGRSFRAKVGTKTYNGNRSNNLDQYYVVRGEATAETPTAAPVAAAAPAPAPAPAPAAASPFDAAPVAAPAPAPAAPVSADESTPF